MDHLHLIEATESWLSVARMGYQLSELNDIPGLYHCFLYISVFRRTTLGCWSMETPCTDVNNWRELLWEGKISTKYWSLVDRTCMCRWNIKFTTSDLVILTSNACTKLYQTYVLFTLPDSDSKPNGSIALCRSFHTVQIQIPILTFACGLFTLPDPNSEFLYYAEISHWFRFGDWSYDWNVCHRDRDLSLEKRFFPKMGTVAI